MKLALGSVLTKVYTGPTRPLVPWYCMAEAVDPADAWSDEAARGVGAFFFLGERRRRRCPIPSWLGWSEYHPKAPYPPV